MAFDDVFYLGAVKPLRILSLLYGISCFVLL